MQKEKRLIYADDLKQEISGLSVTVTGIRAGKGVLAEFMKQYRDSVLRLIDEQPTVDAVEVVPGQWIDRIDNDTPMHECSVCGARVVKGFYEYENPNLYCYHCGACMD